ncbi:Permease of the major facilitator superfamily [Handroanthus impetiginosus]|uniref:Permease of the major facilitator superfamily n=1 Tax=Handroanthus impetiginosus TaxID=429701 RepID=A0A2G9HY19_9LAMI|nr:Permease of the major facilitator superfamily [Handroanthus impetiginosus]
MGSIAEPAPEINHSKPSKPPGIRFIEYTKGSSVSYKTYQALVLIITFFAYLTYHATRKTTSVVKSALDPQSPDVDLKSPFSWRRAYAHKPLESTRNSWVLGSGWAPFNGSDGTALLGELDVAFLFVYAVGMYFSGHVGDRMDLRIFLTIGMVGTGLFTSLFGVGYWANIHLFYYYLIVQMLAGLFQSTGWPSVVAVVGNWFGKKKRGLIMGIWNAHTSLGNITGSVVASILLKYGWGWSMVVPGLGIAFVGIILFFFLPVSPDSVGASIDDDELLSPKKEGEEMTESLLRTKSNDRDAVRFLEALRIPGVLPFALCLFFAKLVAYTFLYWLPFYISHTAIEGRYLSNEESGNLSTLFDVGGVVGGILAGHISDRLDARAITAASFMYCAIPALFFYRSYGHVSMTLNVIFMLITGMFVNGPYALITTAVSADLGTHSSLKGNSRALATVTAIIDGTGSIGAAIGPLLTGYISSRSWSAVFTMLMGAALIAGLLLTRLVVAEVAAKIQGSRTQELPRSRSPVMEV